MNEALMELMVKIGITENVISTLTKLTSLLALGWPRPFLMQTQ
jgi:hypothetical protein